MERVPAIGQRVRYCSHDLEEYEGEPRVCTGIVVAVYESWDEGNRLEPESEWSVGVRVDSRPSWWGYPNTDRFAPQVSELEAI